MNTRDHLIKSIIFRPELTPFVKDEDNSLSYLEEHEAGALIEGNRSGAGQNLPFILVKSRSRYRLERGQLNNSGDIYNPGRRQVSIVAWKSGCRPARRGGRKLPQSESAGGRDAGKSKTTN